MRRFTFYTKELYPMDMKDSNIKYIMDETLRYWFNSNPEQYSYVMRYGKVLKTDVETDYANQRIVTRVTAMMAEIDYVMYKLKY